MPRPNHPTDAEYDNALDTAAHYRLKCLKLEEERDTLLASLEQIRTVANEPFDGSTNSSSDKLKAIDELARKAINKTKGGE